MRLGLAAMLLTLLISACSGQEKPSANSQSTSASTWNTSDANAQVNGNTWVAWRKVAGQEIGALRQVGRDVLLGDVQTAPWKYFGQVVAVGGQVGTIYEFAPESDWRKQTGSNGELIYLTAFDGMAVEFVNAGPVGVTTRGNFLSGWGYAVGYVAIGLANGGRVQGLRIVGRVEVRKTTAAAPSAPPQTMDEFAAAWKYAVGRVGRPDWAALSFKPVVPGGSSQAVRPEGTGHILGIEYDPGRRMGMVNANFFLTDDRLRPGQGDEVRQGVRALLAALQPAITDAALTQLLAEIGIGTDADILQVPKRTTTSSVGTITTACGKETQGRLAGTLWCMITVKP